MRYEKEFHCLDHMLSICDCLQRRNGQNESDGERRLEQKSGQTKIRKPESGKRFIAESSKFSQFLL